VSKPLYVCAGQIEAHDRNEEIIEQLIRFHSSATGERAQAKNGKLKHARIAVHAMRALAAYRVSAKRHDPKITSVALPRRRY
jgi:hypothetical protein